jgi:hypothetical protein
MKGLLIVGFLIISTAPLSAQGAQPNLAKLKADAQKVISIISGDKTKIQTYCQINYLGEQIGEPNEEQDNRKAEALSQKVSELEKKLGPEYVAHANGLKDVDPILQKVLRSVRYYSHSTTPVRISSSKARSDAAGGWCGTSAPFHV